MGVLPPLGLDGVVILLGLYGVPPPPMGLDGGTPLKKTEQQNEHLLHGGRYASCDQAGGLSYFHFIICFAQVLKFSFVHVKNSNFVVIKLSLLEGSIRRTVILRFVDLLFVNNK